jgi:flagellar hook protein FlgE
MSFRLALSGLNAASSDLSVTANNIANTATTGFKGSRALFAEMFAVSSAGTSNTATGNGVRVSNVAQQFSQGNIDFTNNSLDMAISGQGFFILSDGATYTRAALPGRQGRLTPTRQRLQVFPPTAQGGFSGAQRTSPRPTRVRRRLAAQRPGIWTCRRADVPVTVPFGRRRTTTRRMSYDRGTRAYRDAHRGDALCGGESPAAAVHDGAP